jgi:hypothetical protein
VEYYDLQTELVDHLAQGIEAQWKENPELDFEDALQKEFKKFGIFGFSDVIEKRQAAMSKRYNTFIWRHFKEYFRLPKIIFTILTVLCVYFVLSIAGQFKWLVLITFLMAELLLFFLFYKKRIKNENPTKKWMMSEMIHNYGKSTTVFPFYFQIPFLISIHAPEIINNHVYLLIISTFMVLFFIINHIMIYVIPQKAEVYLMETYPEYKFSIAEL